MKNITTFFLTLILSISILTSCNQNKSKQKELTMNDSLQAFVKEIAMDSIARHDSIEFSNIKTNSNQEQTTSNDAITDLETYKFNKGKSDLRYDFATAVSNGTTLPEINQQALHLKAIVQLISKAQFIKKSKDDAKTASDYYNEVIIPAYNKFKYHLFNIYNVEGYYSNTPEHRANKITIMINEYAKTSP